MVPQVGTLYAHPPSPLVTVMEGEGLTASRKTRSCSLIAGALGTGAEEGFEILFQTGKVGLEILDGILDLAQTDLFVGLICAIHSLLVAVLLDDLAAVTNLGETQGSRRSL